MILWIYFRFADGIEFREIKKIQVGLEIVSRI